MAKENTEKIIKLFEDYYKKKFADAEIQAWLNALEGYSLGVLNESAQNYFIENKWLPKLSEYMVYVRKNGYVDSRKYFCDPLEGEFERLKDKFWFEDKIDVTAWGNLAERLERQGRHFFSERVKSYLNSICDPDLNKKNEEHREYLRKLNKEIENA